MGQAEALAEGRLSTKRFEDALFSSMLNATEQGLVPDRLMRWGIRKLLKARLQHLQTRDPEVSLKSFLQATQRAPIAVVPEKANEQHYEVPAEFFQQVLGERLKYSSCFWPEGVHSLDMAEQISLFVTCQHAELEDGQEILELGCGWGSLTLWMAENFPASRITAVSNSNSQREFIEQQAAERGLQNVNVITADINNFDIDQQFDRVVSVEMFEHMRNHSALFHKINDWLRPDGKLFVHVFCHREHPYFFQAEGSQNWMGRYFFTGGMMPSVEYLPRCKSPLRMASQWTWNGNHYARTARAWLEKLDASKGTLRKTFVATYGQKEAVRWHNRWRMFFMACEELFAFNQGNEWFVSHYLFEKTS